MIKRVDYYVGRTALVGVLGVWVALTLLMAMFTFLDQLGEAESTARLSEIAWYVVLKSANSAYVVFPVSALLGAMIGVGGLAAGNELVAFRTAGVSRLRLSGSVMGAVLLLSLVVMVMGEWVMPVAEQQARQLKETRLEASNLSDGSQGMWIRDGNDFITISRYVVYADGEEADVTLHNVVHYAYDDQQRLQRIEGAASAIHDGEGWRLRDSTRVDIGTDGVSRRFRRDQPWTVGFAPEVLSTAVIRPRYMSVRGIVDQLGYLGQNGLDSRAYDSVLWSKLLFPLTVLALVLSGMPFLFGSARTHSLGLRIFIGMSLGGVFMIVSKTMQNFSEAYDLPSAIGAAAPSLVLASVVVLVLRRSV